MVLLLPEKTDIEFEAVVATFTASGGQLRRLGKYWIKDETLTDQPLAIYGNQTFAMVLAQIYNKTLVSPDDTLIARLAHQWVKRHVLLKCIQDISAADFPVFIKPVIPKLFAAGVFDSIAAFQQAVAGLDLTEEILVSGIVAIQAEARGYVLRGEIKDLALYEGSADLNSGRQFLQDFLAENVHDLPETVVVDIAHNADAGWFVLEFNASWGAGLNGCQADKVIDCILAATF